MSLAPAALREGGVSRLPNASKAPGAQGGVSTPARLLSPGESHTMLFRLLCRDSDRRFSSPRRALTLGRVGDGLRAIMAEGLSVASKPWKRSTVASYPSHPSKPSRSTCRKARLSLSFRHDVRDLSRASRRVAEVPSLALLKALGGDVRSSVMGGAGLAPRNAPAAVALLAPSCSIARSSDSLPSSDMSDSLRWRGAVVGVAAFSMPDGRARGEAGIVCRLELHRVADGAISREHSPSDLRRVLERFGCELQA